MNTINSIESFKKTQDVVTYLRQLKKEIMFNQAGIVKEAVDLIIHAAAIGNTEDEYIGVIEIVASSGALWKMTIEQRDDLYAEVKTRFKRNRKTFIDAVNEKNKAILENMPENEKTRLMVDMMNATHANTMMGNKNFIMKKVEEEYGVSHGK